MTRNHVLWLSFFITLQHVGLLMLLNWRTLHYIFHLKDSCEKNPQEPFPPHCGSDPFSTLLRYFFKKKKVHIPVSWAPECGRTKFENHLNNLISVLISTHLTQASFSKKWCCCLQRRVNHLVSAQSILAQVGVDSFSWMKVLLPNPAILTFSSCFCAVRGRNSVQTVTNVQLVVKGIIVFRKSEEFSYSQDRASSIFCKTATKNYKQKKIWIINLIQQSKVQLCQHLLST